MKAILTVIFVLFIGVFAQAQNVETNTKVETIEMGIVTNTTTITYNEIETTNETEVARLYKFKNSRIKKALSFTIKRYRPKMA